jgi:hypothetical protein
MHTLKVDWFKIVVLLFSALYLKQDTKQDFFLVSLFQCFNSSPKRQIGRQWMYYTVE